MGDLQEALAGLGFSKYEAATYLTLVQSHPVSGYELAKKSGVPLAKVYEVIGRLVARGAAVQVSANPALYAPVDPEELVQSLRGRYTELCDDLEGGLRGLQRETAVQYVWNLTTYKEIIRKAIELCQRSTKVLRVLGWAEELSDLRKEVLAAAERGVRVFVVGHGAVDELPGCTLVLHEVLPHLLPERGRQLAVVSDDTAVLLYSMYPHPSGIWSENRGLAVLAREFIMHEAYLWRVVADFKDEITRVYGPNMQRLREW